MRFEHRSVGSELEPCQAEHRRMPEPAERAGMDTAGGVAHGVRQIDARRLTKVTFCERRISQPCCDDSMNGRAQRASMPGPRLVKAEVRLPHRMRESIPEQVDQHHD